MTKAILIVDPDRAAAEALRQKLGSAGLTVRLAAGGGEALDRAEHEHYDLILSALEMPSPNGVELLETLRSRGHVTPFVLLSRDVEHHPEIDARVMPWGQAFVAQRPLSLNWLYDTLETILHVRVDWRESRESPRVPVELDVVLTVELRGVPTAMIGTAVEVGAGGMSFRRRMCEICTGYEPGKVHPDCVLAPYAHGTPAAVTLTRRGQRSVTLSARVVHTRIHEPTAREVIGLQFVNLTDAQRGGLAEVVGTPDLN